jgi:hypothetical protein
VRYSSGELVERHVLEGTVRPRDVNSGRGVRRHVDLRDHEMPFIGIALVVGQRTRVDGDGLRSLSARDTAAMTEAELEEHDREARQRGHK